MVGLRSFRFGLGLVQGFIQGWLRVDQGWFKVIEGWFRVYSLLFRVGLGFIQGWFRIYLRLVQGLFRVIQGYLGLAQIYLGLVQGLFRVGLWLVYGHLGLVQGWFRGLFRVGLRRKPKPQHDHQGRGHEPDRQRTEDQPPTNGAPHAHKQQVLKHQLNSVTVNFVTPLSKPFTTHAHKQGDLLSLHAALLSCLNPICLEPKETHAKRPQAFVVRALKPAVCLHGLLLLGRSSLPFAITTPHGNCFYLTSNFMMTAGWCNIWYTFTALWKITVFNRKISYFYQHVYSLCSFTRNTLLIQITTPYQPLL